MPAIIIKKTIRDVIKKLNIEDWYNDATNQSINKSASQCWTLGDSFIILTKLINNQNQPIADSLNDIIYDEGSIYTCIICLITNKDYLKYGKLKLTCHNKAVKFPVNTINIRESLAPYLGFPYAHPMKIVNFTVETQHLQNTEISASELKLTGKLSLRAMPNKALVAKSTKQTLSPNMDSKKYDVCSRLLKSDIKKLCAIFQVPPLDSSEWQAGEEAFGLWEWLKVRELLSQLPASLKKIERHDLSILL